MEQRGREAGEQRRAESRGSKREIRGAKNVGSGCVRAGDMPALRGARAGGEHDHFSD